MTRKKLPQNSWIKVLYLFIVFGFFVIANLYISDWIVNQVQNDLVVDNDFFSLSYVKNSGAAFSILHNYPMVLISISVVALVLLFAYVIKHSGTMSYIGIFCTTVVMSGIFCNLYERVMLGYVRDFISLKFINFPIFNFSDMLINLGILGIIILLLRKTQLKQL